MPYSTKYLGKQVQVQIDRPLGSRHPRHNFIYPLNYGFVPGTKAPDGEEIDAYVLGVHEPLKAFSGTCVAVIHRTDDDDDKLVVCPSGRQYTDDQIEALVEFQESYFKHVIRR